MSRKFGFCFVLWIMVLGSVLVSSQGLCLHQKDEMVGCFLDAQVYPSLPNWVSANPAYSTGAALADINQDGWLDIVISDGNDMQPGTLNVYYNMNGSFSVVADWQSADYAYNGHVDVADVNGDGWPDVAVSHLGEYSTTAPIARLYLNNQGVLSSTADWFADVVGNAFGVDFGDMNNDGRADLAVATGWSYAPQHFYHNYVYLNTGGMLESTASWQSDDLYHYQGVLWVDADDDGWLDLAGIGTGQDTMVYRNLGGLLETSASWQTTDSSGQDGIMMTAGDVNLDGVVDLFTTDNIQLSGSGLFKQYDGLADGFFEPTYSWNYQEGYGSAVALADVNGDSKLDLATGAWWDNTRLFFNDGSGLSSVASWSSQWDSVIEKIVFGDVGPLLNEYVLTQEYTAFDGESLFYLAHQPIQDIVSICVDGVMLDASEYTFSREHGWFTVSCVPSDSVVVEYTYSQSLDMVVSNWDSDVGNFLYYNQFFEDNLEAEGELVFHEVVAGSVVTGSFCVRNVGMAGSELDWEVLSTPEWGIWTFTPDGGVDVTPEQGDVIVEVEIVAPDDLETTFTGEIILVNSNNAYDFCSIAVELATPVFLGKQTGFLVKKIY